MFETKLLRQLACLKWLQTSKRIDKLADDFLRRFCRHRFNFHTAFRAGHDQRRRAWTIADDRKINFARDLYRFRHQNLTDDSASRAGLMGDEGLAKHLLRDLAHFLRRFHDVDTAFESVFESSLPAATGMNLRLHDDIDLSKF